MNVQKRTSPDSRTQKYERFQKMDEGKFSSISSIEEFISEQENISM